jgi:hypothetical protein
LTKLGKSWKRARYEESDDSGLMTLPTPKGNGRDIMYVCIMVIVSFSLVALTVHIQMACLYDVITLSERSAGRGGPETFFIET